MPQEQTLKYSMQVLEETPPRATKFLSGMGAVPIIRTLMLKAGMTDKDIQEGRMLILSCLCQHPSQVTAQDTEDARKQREALAEIDAWDEPNFRRYGAALSHHYPSAYNYVFYKLLASTGSDSVTGVATFLSRVDTLEKGTDPARAEQKEDDKKAVELLATRGLDDQERTRLATLVHVALGPTEALGDDQVAAERARIEARIQALTALKDWYEDWTEVARTVVKRRDHLIRLGLAHRKMPKQNQKDAAPAVPA